MKLKNYINEESVIDRFPNNNLITNIGLSTIIENIRYDDFAIITSKSVNSMAESIKLNKSIRKYASDSKLKMYQLVGHWNDGKDSIIERSYLFIRDDVDLTSFRYSILKIMKECKQSESLVSLNNNIFIVNDDVFNKVDTGVTLDRINHLYGKYVKHTSVPFTLEVEVPASISGRMIFEMSGVKYPVGCKPGEYREISDLYSIPFDKLSKFLNEANDNQLDMYRKALKEENVIDLIDILEEISYD